MPKGVFVRKGRPAIFPIGPSIAYIYLSQDIYVLVDWADALWLERWRWSVSSTRRYPYARRNFRGADGKLRGVFMHRAILGCDAPAVDHANGNTLDNRRANLRSASMKLNSINSKVSLRNTSGFKGVHWATRKQRWIARIVTPDGKRVISLHRELNDAAAAYDKMAISMYGAYARTNLEIPNVNRPA